jgi:hypothetical protein
LLGGLEGQGVGHLYPRKVHSVIPTGAQWSGGTFMQLLPT